MKLMLHVAPGIVRYPLIASVILETGALVNIERASIDAVSGEIGAGGSTGQVHDGKGGIRKARREGRTSGDSRYQRR